MDDLVVPDNDTLVIVTGSRHWSEYELICEDLQYVYNTGRMVGVVHGGAKGADAWADEWALEHPDVARYVFLADWKTHGKAAGMIRNKQMVDFALGERAAGWYSVIVLAYPAADSKGTVGMMRECRKAGLPVINRAG